MVDLSPKEVFLCARSCLLWTSLSQQRQYYQPSPTTCTKVTNMPPSTRRSQRSTRRSSPSESMDENEVSLKQSFSQRYGFRFLEVCFSFLNTACHCHSGKNETVQRVHTQSYLFLYTIAIWSVYCACSNLFQSKYSIPELHCRSHHFLMAGN